MILLIDNYDSFAHNLARYLRRLGQEVQLVRNDAIDATDVRQLAPQAIVLSPGPCTPNEAGCSLEVVRQFHDQLPILGICLGHQTIAAALGAQIIRASIPMHGRTSLVRHDRSVLFDAVPSPLTVCRYHSLAVEPSSLPSDLHATATCDDGTIMALQHRNQPVYGLQFHPEAILTEHGYRLLYNFLQAASLTPSDYDTSLVSDELRRPALLAPELPEQPVTF